MIKQSYEDLKQTLLECFASDSDLLEKWHIVAGSGLDVCVARTLRDVQETFDESFEFHKIYDGTKLAGYYGLEFGNYINLVFVKPEYRKKEFMTYFWDQIQSKVSDKFHTAVYAKNLPAIEFYKRHAKTVDNAKINGTDIVVFSFERDLCL